MTSTPRARLHHHETPGPTQTTRSQTTRAVRQSEAPWWGDPTDGLDWWTSPSLAYWKGLVDGARLQRERESEEYAAAIRAAYNAGIAESFRPHDRPVLRHLAALGPRGPQACRERADRGEVS